MATTREMAMDWWNNLSSLTKTQICDINTEIVGKARRWETLTGSEIEKLWGYSTASQTPTKPTGMEGEFLNTVETLAANLKTRLLREAVKEWEQHRKNTEITPAMAQRLAADMVRRELAMEVYYSLSTKH